METQHPSVLEVGKRRLNRLTHQIHALPILVLMPHSRCNCRCVMCDIWRANERGYSLTRADLDAHIESLRRLSVRQVVLSGGEALLHANLWSLCERLKELRVSITLLSTGLLLAAHAVEIARWTDEVIVSLDGSQPVHDCIRNIPHAYTRLQKGIMALKIAAPEYRVSARCTLQRANYRDLPNIIAAAHELGLDRISFLAADVSSAAFNRPQPWEPERVAAVALAPAEVTEFEAIIEGVIRRYADDFMSGYIAESPDRLRRLPRYFAALNSQGDFPAIRCNAPWVSAVVEADGEVRPCFFHRSYGNFHTARLDEILNAPGAVAFRRGLYVHTDPTCRKCVCTLDLPARASFVSFTAARDRRSAATMVKETAA